MATLEEIWEGLVQNISENIYGGNYDAALAAVSAVDAWVRVNLLSPLFQAHRATPLPRRMRRPERGEL